MMSDGNCYMSSFIKNFSALYSEGYFSLPSADFINYTSFSTAFSSTLLPKNLVISLPYFLNGYEIFTPYMKLASSLPLHS